VREVAEETRLEIELRRLIGVYVKRSEHDLVFVFAAAAVGGELATSEERDRVAFLDPCQLPEQTSDLHRERIADARAGGQAPVSRTSIRSSTARNGAPPARLNSRAARALTAAMS
jgi:ADP-ribose pyrophosphatase YjhB (NUDIX family)